MNPLGGMNTPFGGATQNNPSTGFGSTATSGFGQAMGTSPFGRTATTSPMPSAFGTGMVNTNPSSGLFGNTPQGPTNTSFGGFGNPAPTPSTSTFGAPMGGTSAFGAPNSSGNLGGGLFGAPSSTSGTFGSSVQSNTATPFGGSLPQGGSAFGTQPNPQPFGSTSNFGAFGSPNTISNMPFGMATTMGSANPKYSSTQEKDTITNAVNTYHSITAMPAYARKSFEELRWEDYQQNRKGVSTFGSTTPAFGMTPPASSTAPTGGLFGSQMSSTTPQPFGASNAPSGAPFGFGSTNPTNTPGTGFGTLFGSQQAATPSPFGQPTQQSGGGGGGLFGANQPSSTTPSFGAGTFGSGFGSSAVAPAASSPFSFGQQSTTSAPALSSPGFGFGGAPTPSTGTGLFGAPSTTPAFGTQAPPANAPFSFGSTGTSQPGASGSLFGAPTGTNTLFGVAPNQSQPGSTGFTFGGQSASATPQSASGNLFSSGFGTSKPPTAPNTFSFAPLGTNTNVAVGSGISQPGQQGGSLFGGASQQPSGTPGFSFGSGQMATPASGGSSLFGRPAMTNFGGNLNVPTSSAGRPSQFSFAPSSSAMPVGGGLFGSGMGSILSSTPSTQPFTLNAGQPQGTPLQATIDSKPYGSSSLFQNLPPSSISMPPTTGLGAPITTEKLSDRKNMPPSQLLITPRSATKMRPRGYTQSPGKLQLFDNLNKVEENTSPDMFTPRRQSVKKLVIIEKPGMTNGSLNVNSPLYRNMEVTSPTETPSKSTVPEGGVRPLLEVTPTQSPKESKRSSVKLSDPSYRTKPAFEQLSRFFEDELARVEGFSISRDEYGEIEFLRPVDLRNLDLSKTVVFAEKEVTVYPKEENKPSIGTGLNQPALIRLHRCWPIDKSTRQPIKDFGSDRLQRHILKLKSIPDTEFVDYSPETGTWIFKVQHFSKYGLADDSDSDEPIQAKKQQEQKFGSSFIKSDGLAPMETPQESEEMSDEPNIRADLIEDHFEVSTAAFLPYGQQDEIYYNESEKQNTTAGLSRHLGLTPRRLQVMKASLFQEHQASDHQSAQLSNLGLETIMDTSSAGQDLCPKAGYERSEIMSTENIDGGFETESRQDRLIQLRNYQKIDYQCSLTYLNEGILLDAGLALTKSFRPGWINTQRFLSRGSAVNSIVKSSLFLGQSDKNDVSIVCNCKIGLESEANKNIYQNIKKIMEFELQNTEVKQDAGVPYLIRHTVSFDSFLNWAKEHNNLSLSEESIYRLASSLWDDLEGTKIVLDRPFPEASKSISCYLFAMQQKMNVSEWLTKVVSEDLDKRLSSRTDVEAIFELLICNQVERACFTAIKSKNVRLSTLLSQAPGDLAFREDLRTQMRKWEQFHTTEFINPRIQDIFRLLAGDIEKICFELDWLRGFGVYLWYNSNTDDTLELAIRTYQNAFERGIARIPSSPFVINNESLDIRFHLLKLFSDPTHPLEKALHPLTYGSCLIDYRLGWHLFVFLKSLKVRGFISERTETLLHSNFADQLERLGLIEWSVFVLLHLSDPVCRQRSIKGLLARVVPSKCNGELYNQFVKLELFLINKLSIPASWIEEAKAFRACFDGDYQSQIQHLIKCGDFDLAHEILMDHFVVNAVVSDNYDFIQKVLAQLRGKSVKNWTSGGELLSIYIEVKQNIGPVMKALSLQQFDRSEELYKLKDMIVYFLTNAAHLKHFKNVRARVVHVEMCSRMSALLQELDSELLYDPIVHDLNVLPEDRRLSRVFRMSDHYFHSLLPMH